MTTPTTTTFNVFTRILCDVYDDKTIIAIYREYCQFRDNAQWSAENGNPDALKELPTPEQYAEYEREKAEQNPAGWFIYWED